MRAGPDFFLFKLLFAFGLVLADQVAEHRSDADAAVVTMWVTAVRVFAKATVSTAEAVHPHDVAVLVFLDLDPGFCNRREGFGKGDFPNKEPRGWFEGWYWNLPVRDSVALELARMLGLEIELKRDRTPKEWARIRSEIQARLKQEFGKPM